MGRLEATDLGRDDAISHRLRASGVDGDTLTPPIEDPVACAGEYGYF